MNPEYDDLRVIAKTCAEVRDLLPSLATLAAIGRDPAPAYPEAMAHIADCAECQAEWTDLCDVTRLAFDGDIEPARSYPPTPRAPDPAQPRRPAANQAGQPPDRIVTRLVHGLLDALRPPKPGFGWRGTLYGPCDLNLAPSRLKAQVEIKAQDGDPTLGTVAIEIEDPAADPFEQSGFRVKLWADTTTWTRITDAKGLVIFPAIPLALTPQLRLEILPTNAADSA